MKKILITGHTGFVGKNISAYLGKDTQYKVYGVARSENNMLEGINEVYTWNELLKENVVSPDVIVHLAGKAHDIKAAKEIEAEYLEANYEPTKKIFDLFMDGTASVFIFLSSVKAAADKADIPLTEDHPAQPVTAYGKSKLLAEQYILSHTLPDNKHVYILRPCMIHGPGNRGNLNLLYSLIVKGIPYPLGAFDNKRSFLTVGNLCITVNELITGSVPSGTYNIADDEPLSTVELIQLMNTSLGKKARIWNISPKLIRLMAKAGDVLKLPINSERLEKLTENYIVDNRKLKEALGKPFSFNTREGIINTIKGFKSR